MIIDRTIYQQSDTEQLPLPVLRTLKSQLSDSLANTFVRFPVLVLIGPSGAGKTSVGAEFAQRQNLTHVDMDSVIESSSKLAIPDIFTAYGEADFRELENHFLDLCVAMISGNNASMRQAQPKFVISAGGGTPVFPGNIEKMRELGTVIGLTASTDTLLERLEGKQERPMLDRSSVASNRREALESLLAARKTIYEQAALTIDTTELSIIEVSKLIEQKLCK